MKRNWLLGLAAVLLGLTAVSMMAGAVRLAFGENGPLNRAGGPRGDCTAALVAAIGLSTDQATTLDALRQQTADSAKTIADQEHTLRQQIETAVAAANP